MSKSGLPASLMAHGIHLVREAEPLNHGTGAVSVCLLEFHNLPTPMHLGTLSALAIAYICTFNFGRSEVIPPLENLQAYRQKRCAQRVALLASVVVSASLLERPASGLMHGGIACIIQPGSSASSSNSPAKRSDSAMASAISGYDEVPDEATGMGGRREVRSRRLEEWGTGKTGLPCVTLKLAMDRNGAVDDMSEGPKRFTCQASLDAVHRIRRDCNAVLVGVGTVVRDDPSLTVRRVPLEEGRRQPIRVVLDRTLRMPGVGECKILGDGYESLIFYSAGCEQGKKRALAMSTEVVVAEAPVEFVALSPSEPEGPVPMIGVLETLAERGMEHILVEGGPATAKGFLAECLVDRAIIVRAPMEFARPVPSGMDTETLRSAGLELVGSKRWGDDKAECWSRPSLAWPCGGIEKWP